MNDIVIVTAAFNNDYYYCCCKNLLDILIDKFEIFLYTDNLNEFSEYNSIKIIEKKKEKIFPYHDKFVYINEIRNIGYNKICFIDSDLYLYDKMFIYNLKSFISEPGFYYTKIGFDSNILKIKLNTDLRFKTYNDFIKSNNIDYTKIIVPRENLFVFNFENLNADNLFEKYSELRKERESKNLVYDNMDAEGITFGIAALCDNFPMVKSELLENQLIFFRDNHYFDGNSGIPPITKECDFIFLNNKNINNKMMKATVDFYRKHFKFSSFFIFDSDKTICELKLSKNKTCIVIYNGSFMTNFSHLQNEIDMVVRGIYDYLIPFNSKFILPYLIESKDICGSMYIINKLILFNNFNDCGWIRTETEHMTLIYKNIKFRESYGDLIFSDENNLPIKKII